MPEQELYGILVDEIENLHALKEAGRHHRAELGLKGNISDIRKLELYPTGFSVRIYFTVIDGVLWMLGLDCAKRRTAMTQGTIDSLKQRLREVRATHISRGLHNGRQ